MMWYWMGGKIKMDNGWRETDSSMNDRTDYFQCLCKDYNLHTSDVHTIMMILEVLLLQNTVS